MKSLFKPLIIAIFNSLSLILGLSTYVLPSIQDKSAGNEALSAERAKAHVERIAAKTHPVDWRILIQCSGIMAQRMMRLG